MRYQELKDKIKQNIFTLLDVFKAFPEKKEETIKVQLHRFFQTGRILQIKRGLYCFDGSTIDEFELASLLYKPSYISLETALNYYGIIPDIPAGVTSVTTITTKKVKNIFGSFYYHKVKPDLFFGFERKQNFYLAQKEKALLDYFYLRKITDTAELRLDTHNLNKKRYNVYKTFFPAWVGKIKV